MTTISQLDKQSLNKNGFLILQNYFDVEEISKLKRVLSNLPESLSVKKRGDAAYGIRNLLNLVPEIQFLAKSEKLKFLIEPILGQNAFPVKGIYFDKTSKANWKVIWHQDLTITVKEKIETEGFEPWTVKDGIPHVQPPRKILENILTIRIHLDPTISENGALKVIPGSHCLGRLTTSQVNEFKERNTSTSCEVMAGGVLIMRPLLLHSSSESQNLNSRRIIHLEFSSQNLPNGFKWFGS